MFSHRISTGGSLIVLLTVLAAQATAQVTTATFSGIVVDSSGAVVPGAEVTLANQGTGSTTLKVTDNLGEFVFNFVQVGTYTLKIEMPGFKTFESTDLQVRAGQNIRRRFALEVGEVSETVTVRGEATLVNTVSVEQRQAFSNLELKELPLARRNFSQILQLATGVTRGLRGDTRGRFRLNGLGGSGTRVTVEGTEASGDPSSLSTTSAYQNFNRIDIMSIESIEEVQLIKGVIPAEYGKALAGNINLITRSGTNEWHGSLFYNYQGAVLGARHQFATSKPNFVWNQYGGSLGGPIVRNRAFFFAAYEGYQESSFRIVNGDVPTESFRRKMFAALPFPETKLFLDVLPLPNQPHDPEGISGEWRGAGSLTAQDNHLDAKGDVRIGEAANLSVGYSRGRPEQTIPRVSPQNSRTWFGTQERGTINFVTGRGNWTWETRFGVNYSDMERIDHYFNVMDPNQSETVFGGRRAPSLQCCGLTQLGTESNIRGRRPSYDFSQKYAYILGKHSLKFGGSYFRRGMGRINVENVHIQYQTAADLLANRPRQVIATLGVNPYVSDAWSFGLFLQDDWRMTPKLVLNLGLRYDYFSTFSVDPTTDAPAGLYNLDGLLDRNFNFGPLRDLDKPIESDPLNFGPRIGFAYNPDGEGKYVIRGGFSVMFSSLDFASFDNAVGNTPTTPFRARFSAKEAAKLGLRWPLYNEDVIRVLEAQGQQHFQSLFDPEIDAPYAMNMYLGIQRALGSSAVFETAFVGTRGVKFTMNRVVNQPDRLTGVRANPELGEPFYFDNSQQTFYASWQSSLQKRFRENLGFAFHYTWSKAMAYTGGDVGAGFNGDNTGTTQDFWCIPCDRGPSTGDISHYLTVNWIYQLPVFSDWSGLARSVLGGWGVSGLFTATTGEPIQIVQPNALRNQRPDMLDLKAAINTDCCGPSLQYLNPAAFQPVPVSGVSRATIRPGSLGNHALRGPGLWNLDLAIGKKFEIPWVTVEGAALQIRADLLNALNHTNYTAPVTNLDRKNFGQIRGTAGARVIQLGARIDF